MIHKLIILTKTVQAYLPDGERKANLDSKTKQDSKTSAEFDESISSCFFAYGIPVEKCPPNVKDLPNEEKWALVKKDMQEQWCSK